MKRPARFNCLCGGESKTFPCAECCAKQQEPLRKPTKDDLLAMKVPNEKVM